jgi:hypothetical protein
MRLYVERFPRVIRLDEAEATSRGFGAVTSPCGGGRRGAILPLVAVTLIGLLALVALGIDGGILQRERRLAQNAADAGAQAGAQEILRTQIQDTVYASARNEAARNGFADGVNGVTVTVDTLATGQAFGGGKYVRVRVSKAISTIFSGALGRSSVTVHAQAIGGIVPPSASCIVALDPSSKQTLMVQSGAQLTASGCGISVNSSNSDALDVRGTGSVLDGTGAISVRGNYVVASGGTITNTPQTGVAAAPDPMAYLTMPAPGPCSPPYNTVGYKVVQPQRDTTLQPGVYCGGIKVGTVNVTFAPGMYWLMGGGMDIGSAGHLDGTGVTFINMNGPAADGGANKFGIINMQNNGTVVNLSAMTTGPLAGILFYQDPSAGKAGQTYVNMIKSGVGTTFSGSLYFPTQDLTVESGGSITVNGGIVAQQILVQNNATHLTVTGAGGGSGYFKLKRASIIE